LLKIVIRFDRATDAVVVVNELSKRNFSVIVVAFTEHHMGIELI